VQPSSRHLPTCSEACRRASSSAWAVGSPRRSRWLPAFPRTSVPRATTAPTGTSPHSRQARASSRASRIIRPSTSVSLKPSSSWPEMTSSKLVQGSLRAATRPTDTSRG
jgi:hypothetical protein